MRVVPVDRALAKFLGDRRFAGATRDRRVALVTGKHDAGLQVSEPDGSGKIVCRVAWHGMAWLAKGAY